MSGNFGSVKPRSNASNPILPRSHGCRVCQRGLLLRWLRIRKPMWRSIATAAIERQPSCGCAKSFGYSKAKIARRTLRRVRAASRDAVAVAIGGMAEEGAAAHRALACGLRKQRVLRSRLTVIGRAEPVGAPFPHIAAGIDQAECVGLAVGRGNWLRAPPFLGCVWERPTPDVAARHAVSH